MKNNLVVSIGSGQVCGSKNVIMSQVAKKPDVRSILSVLCWTVYNHSARLHTFEEDGARRFIRRLMIVERHDRMQVAQKPRL